MASLHKIHSQEIVDRYFESLRYANGRRGGDIAAATAIQSIYRQYCARRDFLTACASAINIQRVFRGYLHGRLVFRKTAEEKRRMEIELYFHTKATTIQRVFRGWYFRKYKHDFKLRRQYLDIVEQRNKEVMNMLKKYQEKQRDKSEEEELELQKFKKVASNLHHLISTKSIPGIYKTDSQTVYNTNIEDELRVLASANALETLSQKKTSRYKKRSVRETTKSPPNACPIPRHMHYVPGMADATQSVKQASSVRLLPPIDRRDRMRTRPERRLGPFLPQNTLTSIKEKKHEVSVARSLPYGEDRRLEQFDRKIDRMVWLAGDFIPNRKPDPLRWTETLRSRGEYIDPAVGSL